MVCDEIDEKQMEEELMGWFIQRLDELQVPLDDDACSYDCNTVYDHLFFQLQADAKGYMAERYGYSLSPGQLTQSFFAAEYERSRRDRLARCGWVARFSDFVSGKGRPR